MRTLIFDFDGTLADTFPLVVDISYKLSETAPMSPEKIALLRRKPLMAAVRSLGIAWWHIPRLMRRTRLDMYARMLEVKTFPGMAEELKKLHQQGYKMFILTSNHKRNVQAFLRIHNLTGCFSGITSVFYGNTFYKVRGFRRIMREQHIRPADCCYIGNETIDIRAAKKVAIKAIGVTWSGAVRKQLEAEQPLAVIKQPSQLTEVLAPDEPTTN